MPADPKEPNNIDRLLKHLTECTDMKSLPDSEIKQLATKPGPKQYRPCDDSEIKQLATKPGPKQYLAFDELARRIRYNPSMWSPPAGP